MPVVCTVSALYSSVHLLLSRNTPRHPVVDVDRLQLLDDAACRVAADELLLKRRVPVKLQLRYVRFACCTVPRDRQPGRMAVVRVALSA